MSKATVRIGSDKRIEIETLDGRIIRLSETEFMNMWNNQAQTVLRLEQELKAARQSRARLVKRIRACWEALMEKPT